MPRKFTDASAMFRDIQGRMDRIVAEGRHITKDNGEYGADLVRDTVETSGTAKSGKRGRIDTGAMLESIGDDYEVIPNGAQSTYGFLNAPYYTRFQEDGTIYVEGMFAVDDAASNVEVDYVHDLQRLLDKEW